MPASKYTSFQIKNTTSVPMEISLSDPDGNNFTVGPLDPGEESIQVAPIGTTWRIRFVSSDETSGGSDARKGDLLQDYDRHAEIYRPYVAQSRVIARDGDEFRVFLRFFMKKVINLTVNSDHLARFTTVNPTRVYSRIVSTRVQEVQHAGSSDERELPVGQDGGYLWRINSYWRFLERDGGVYVQCESVTLSRGIPFGLRWVVGPFVTSIPRESLTFTLETTRKVLGSR